MSKYTEKRFLRYAPPHLFELVAAVERYPEFLPWCLAAYIRTTKELPGAPNRTLVVADLVVGLRLIRKRYTSRVTLQPPHRIDVRCVDGPFEYLNNRWIFEPVAPDARRPVGGTMLTFDIEFEFRSIVLQSLVGGLLNEAARHMVAAFEGRAKRLYGARPSVRAGLRELAQS